LPSSWPSTARAIARAYDVQKVIDLSISLEFDSEIQNDRPDFYLKPSAFFVYVEYCNSNSNLTKSEL
jgi:hypothetical protein